MKGKYHKNHYNIIFATKTPRKNTRKYLAKTRKRPQNLKIPHFHDLLFSNQGIFSQFFCFIDERIRSLKNHTQAMPSAISMRG